MYISIFCILNTQYTRYNYIFNYIPQLQEASHSLYCSEWYNLYSINERKIILFFLMNTQNVTGFVSSFGLFDLSYETFTQVIYTYQLLVIFNNFCFDST